MNPAIKSKLTIEFYAGLTEDGKESYVSKSFQQIRNRADSAPLYEAAQALASLQSLPVSTIVRTNEYSLHHLA